VPALCALLAERRIPFMFYTRLWRRAGDLSRRGGRAETRNRQPPAHGDGNLGCAGIRMQSQGKGSVETRAQSSHRSDCAPKSLKSMQVRAQGAHLLVLSTAQSGRALTGAVSCAVADHEIAHSKLYQDEGGRHHTAVRLIHWICRRDGCPVAWLETARRLSLYTEVYCDIAGYLVTGNRDTSTGRKTTSSRKCTAGRAAATTSCAAA
jgi:hypothetical protein